MGVMSARAPGQVLDELLQLLPPSEYLARTADSNFGRLLAGPAAAIADAEAQAVEFGDEVQPGSAVALLPDYQRVLGPDPCGRDLLALSAGDQQALVASRWTARGGQSPAYFVDLAASLGTTITITEGSLFTAGVSEAGDTLAVDGDQFAWQVSLPTSRVVDFIAGSAEAGDALGGFAANLCECVIRLQAPAHTTPVFDYRAPLDSYDLTGALPAGFALTRASPATYFDAAGTLQEVAANVARPNHDPVTLAPLGTLLEIEGSNQVGNPRCEGVTTSFPPGWGGYATAGLAWTTVGTGTEDGLSYVDMRLSGTTTAAATAAVQWTSTIAIPAANGETWTNSAFIRLIAGSLDNLTNATYPRFQIVDLASGGGFLAGTNMVPTITDAPLRTQRLVFTRRLDGGATVAHAQGGITFGYSAGTVVDVTLRIAGPQMERSPVATSVMLPPVGSPGVSTRSADTLTLPLPVLGFPGEDGWSALLEFAPTALPGDAAVFGVGIAGDADNTTYALASAADQLRLVKRVGGASAGPSGAAPLAIDTLCKAVIGQDAVDARMAVNGAAVAVASLAGYPAANQLVIGGALPMHAREVMLWPRMLADDEFQSMSGA
jgi:uncharacterized protein YmfQ (DUF2313 family)